ncbi:MAG: phosphatase PAP2 family protein, partial [Chlorobi bacterium]|nr:phosphatase PAP2 family protein [Chlorobiota bacterium]
GSAGVVGAARIYHDKHWVSDVFLGGAIGYFVGRFVVNLNNVEDSEFSGLNISPTLSFDKVGLQMSLRF